MNVSIISDKDQEIIEELIRDDIMPIEMEYEYNNNKIEIIDKRADLKLFINEKLLCNSYLEEGGLEVDFIDFTSEGDIDVISKGDIDVISEGDIDVISEGDIDVISKGDVDVISEGDLDVISEDDHLHSLAVQNNNLSNNSSNDSSNILSNDSSNSLYKIPLYQPSSEIKHLNREFELSIIHLVRIQMKETGESLNEDEIKSMFYFLIEDKLYNQMHIEDEYSIHRELYLGEYEKNNYDRLAELELEYLFKKNENIKLKKIIGELEVIGGLINELKERLIRDEIIIEGIGGGIIKDGKGSEGGIVGGEGIRNTDNELIRQGFYTENGLIRKVCYTDEKPILLHKEIKDGEKEVMASLKHIEEAELLDRVRNILENRIIIEKEEDINSRIKELQLKIKKIEEIYRYKKLD
eukprot:GHVP01029793.1.p1 GENE.GHVP01029793.1~~GHVP01029793.1.p1  ORF type:complete len:458 (+),score=93.81 GHVP01029793.1:149-1375(+)